MKVDVFIGPQICQIFRDHKFDLTVSDDENAAWNAFWHVATGFLGNIKAINLLEASGESYNFLWEAWLQLVTQDTFPAFTLGFLSDYCGAVSDKHGECFHQDSSTMENTYKGKWSAAILAVYCWTMKSDAPEI